MFFLKPSRSSLHVQVFAGRCLNQRRSSKSNLTRRWVELLDKKGSSSKDLSKEKYKFILNRLVDLAAKPVTKKTSQHYRLQRPGIVSRH